MAAPETRAVNATIVQSNDRTHRASPDTATAQDLDRIVHLKLHQTGWDRATKADKHDDRSFFFLVISFALLAMLILLLTLQATLCCGTDTPSDLAPPRAQVQEKPADQLPSPYDIAVAAAGTHFTMPPPAAEQTVETKPGTAAPAATALSSSAAVPPPATAKPENPVDAAFNSPVMALASAPAAPPDPDEMQSDAAAALAAVSSAGFIKLANTGAVLGDDADSWECVEDRSSHLTWEVKKNDGGIRDRDNSYSWLNDADGGQDGTGNGGRCKGGISCDTSSYARAINERGLCGYTDWRLPTKEELETLVDYGSGTRQATINTTYFPEAIPSWYWTASENPQRADYAWYVLFRNGIALNDLKERPKHIRLVRGNPEQ